MAGKGPHLHAGQQASISLEAPQARPRVPRLVVHGSTMLRAYFCTNLVGTLIYHVCLPWRRLIRLPSLGASRNKIVDPPSGGEPNRLRADLRTPG
jgi:hypothetical protein